MTYEAVTDLLGAVAYKDWRFVVGRDDTRMYLQVMFTGPCAATGKPYAQHGRKWLLSPHMTKSEVITTAFKAVLTAEEHETRERFRYRGQAIFGPHFDVDQLYALAALGAADVREAVTP